MQFAGSSTTEAYNFDYDRVYKLDSKEESRRLFVELVQPLLDRFLMGFNVTVREIAEDIPTTFIDISSADYVKTCAT